MFIFLEHRDIDKKKWDASIESSINKNIYAYSWFLDAVCPQWTALVDENYKVLMPLPSRVKMGIHYLFEPFFAQQLGAFFKDEKDSKGIMDAIPAFYKYQVLKLNTSFHSVAKGFDILENLNYTLSLSKSYDELFKAYAYNTKRNVRKCSEDLILVSDFDDVQAINMFELNRGAKLANYRKEGSTVLVKLIKSLKEKKKLEKWAVLNKEGQLLAAAHFAVFENKRIFLFSATDEDGKKERAMFFLIDRFIAKYANTNVLLDFSGSNDLDLARFYSGFGADKEIYYRVVKNRLPLIIRWLKK